MADEHETRTADRLRQQQRNRYAVPADVRLALERLFDTPGIAAAIDVVYRPIYVRAHLMFVGASFGSVTRPGRIYTSIPETVFFGLDEHLLHEYYHVIQQWGRERMTIPGYLWNAWRREREAQRFAKANVATFVKLRRTCASGSEGETGHSR
jgi:hypothetical protein